MNILNIEDDAFKHHDICKVVNENGSHNIDWVMYLDEAISKIESQIILGKPYNLIITDMYYPASKGGAEEQSGEILIKKAKEIQPAIPIIICSSCIYNNADAFGTIYYSEREDWELKLSNLIAKIKHILVQE